MNTDIFLFSTTDLASGRGEAMQRMVASVGRARQDRPQCRIRLLILFQNTAIAAIPEMPDWVEVHTSPTRIPLSMARNRLLDSVVLPATAETSAVVAFPDDDAWYPDGSLHFMRDQVAEQGEVDLAFCRYGAAPIAPPTGLTGRLARLQQVLSHGSSITMFLRASLAAQLGHFDETLGLGTPAGSGEDTDYAMRAWHMARRTLYYDAPLIGHRDKDMAGRTRYYPGSLAAISRNRHLSPSARLAHLRKLAVGVIRRGL